MINIQDTHDNECFKWYLARYINTENHHSARIRKTDKQFAKILDSKDIKFPVKVRDVQKTEKKNFIGINIVAYENKENYIIYVSKKCCEEKHADLSLIVEEGKRHYDLKLLILSCMIIVYIVEENIFVPVVHKL